MPEIGDSSRLQDLDDPSYQLVTGSQDVAAVLDSIDANGIDCDDVTGCVVSDDEVWISYASRPQRNVALYHRVV
jgi:hypothetical protein